MSKFGLFLVDQQPFSISSRPRLCLLEKCKEQNLCMKNQYIIRHNLTRFFGIPALYRKYLQNTKQVLTGQVD